MKFLIDANLPPAMALWLRQRGHEARYVDDVLPPPALDEQIWSEATSSSEIIISKDGDFVLLAQRLEGPAVVWIRCGNLTLSVFEGWFGARSDEMAELLLAGERVVELR